MVFHAEVAARAPQTWRTSSAAAATCIRTSPASAPGDVPWRHRTGGAWRPWAAGVISRGFPWVAPGVQRWSMANHVVFCGLFCGDEWIFWGWIHGFWCFFLGMNGFEMEIMGTDWLIVDVWVILMVMFISGFDDGCWPWLISISVVRMVTSGSY